MCEDILQLTCLQNARDYYLPQTPSLRDLLFRCCLSYLVHANDATVTVNGVENWKVHERIKLLFYVDILCIKNLNSG